MARKGFFRTAKAFSCAAALFAGTLGVALFGAVFASCENLNGDMSSPAYAPSSGGADGGQGAGGQGVADAAGASMENCLTASVSLPGLPSLAGIAPLPKNVAHYAAQSGAVNPAAQSGASDPAAQSGASKAPALDGVQKSAFPNIADAAGTAYSFSATLTQSGGATYSADGTYDGVTATCSFAFAGAKSSSAQDYTLTVKLYHTDAAVKSLVASGSQSVTVGADAPSFSASVSLAPNLESGAPNGSLNLPIKFSDTSVTSVQLTLLDSGNHDVTASYLDCGTSLTLTGGSGTIASVAGGLPAGTYTLLMSFMKGTAQVGARTESLNVYPAMETSLWWTKDGIGAAATALSVTQFNQKEFYVRGTGGVFYTTVFPTAAEAQDTNNGSFAFPLKTIQEAVNRIKASGDTTSQYTVYIDGKVTVPADADYSTISDDYKKSLAYIDSAQKIAITGWTGSGFDIIDCGKKCRAITAASGAEVAITKLAIKNGDGVNYGGALYVGGGDSTVVLDDGALVNGNHCETNGGAIYCNGNLYICGSAVVGDYSPSMTAALEDDCGNLCDGSGGGVSCSGNLYLGYSGKNSSGGLIEKALSGGIYRNYSKTYGGGIYSTGTVTMASGSVDFNAATNGGGVYVSGSSTSSGKFYMGGTSRISGNEATSAGGGVYNSESGIFCMAGSAIVGADPSGLTEAAKVDNGKHSNMAKYGGGILIGKPSGFKFGYKNEATSDPTFAGGVYYNYSTNGGGGIRVDCPTGTGQIFNFERGSVCYNSSGLVGGGITVLSVTSNPKIYITGGQVSNNSAGTDGGGIHAQNVYVAGGTIAGNSASMDGGGVFASEEFYLYGSGVIGDASKAQVAAESDCSNKAKAGGGVYASKVYIGYSDASTPAACSGGIYHNYATATRASPADTYCYGGGGICIRGTSAGWLFKMQSGTVAYNAADSSDGYGGGLFIYGSGAPDSSIAYPEATGGSFVGNGAKYGGAVCCYSRTLGLGGSIYMPSATGEKGDNDIYLQGAFLHLLSNFDSATPTPVVTVTPPSYSIGQKIFNGTIGDECEKIGIASNTAGWAVKNDGTLYKDCSELYVSASGVDDTAHDGSVDKPYATISYAASKFSQPERPIGGTEYAPLFKNKIYIISDMTFTVGAGATGNYNFEVIGRLGGPAGDVGGKPVPVTLTFNTSGSGFYVPTGQKIKFTNINITQDSGLNDYAAILADGGTFYMEDCSIKGMATKDCSAIAADGTNAGKIYLKNVEISGNKVEQPNISGAKPWGPAVSVKSGTLAILGKVVIGGNTMKISDGAGGYVYKEMNVWIGDNPYPNPAVFNPIVIGGILDSESDIGVTLFDYGTLYTTFTSGFASAGISAPSDVFTSDDGMSVIKNISGEAIMTAPVSLYVSQTGNDLIGNGSRMAPFATINKAISTINAFDTSGISYTIYVGGTVKGYAEIPDGVKAAKITLDKDPLSLVTNTLDGVGKASPVLTINAAIPVDISNLTITRGSRGVDIEKSATVKITDCVVTGNDGSVTGAGIYVKKGSVDISGTEISGNTTSSNGGGLYVESSGVTGFTMTGGAITGNSAGSGGGADINCQKGANPLMDGVTISGNTASAGNGGGIFVTSGMYLGIKDCVISGNTAGTASVSGHGGGIYNAGTCYIYGSTVIGDAGAGEAAKLDDGKHSNLATGYGGGIYNVKNLYLGYSDYISPTNNAPEPLTGGVYYNFAGRGGAIYAASSTQTVMASGTYKYNSVPSSSGGGAIFTAGTLTMHDGLIDGNVACLGGGVYVSSSGSFTMNDGTISDNYANESDSCGGGGVLVAGAFAMNSGAISGNHGYLGGGVYVSSDSSMSGGTISGNDAVSGGGVYIVENKFTMTGGVIEENTATVNGGGVDVHNDGISSVGTLVLGDNAYIPLGTTNNDVYLCNAISLVSSLDKAAPVVTITPSVYGTTEPVLTEATPGLVGGNYDKFAVTPDGSDAWSIDQYGYLSQSASSGGSVTIYTPDGQLGLSVNTTEVTTSASATSIIVSAKNASGVDISTSADISGWTLDWYYGSSSEPIVSSSGRTFSFPKTYPKGTYRLTVSVVYKGTTYSDTFTIKKTVD